MVFLGPTQFCSPLTRPSPTRNSAKTTRPAENVPRTTTTTWPTCLYLRYLTQTIYCLQRNRLPGALRGRAGRAYNCGHEQGYSVAPSAAGGSPTQINLLNLNAPDLASQTQPRFLYLWTGQTYRRP